MEAKSAWAIVHWIRYESVKKHLAEGFIMHEKSGNASLEHLNTAQSSDNLFFTCWGLEFHKYSQIPKWSRVCKYVISTLKKELEEDLSRNNTKVDFQNVLPRRKKLLFSLRNINGQKETYIEV